MSRYKRDYHEVENGMVVGYIGTGMIGSYIRVDICPVEEAEEMSDEELEGVARDIILQYVSWGY